MVFLLPVNQLLESGVKLGKVLLRQDSSPYPAERCQFWFVCLVLFFLACKSQAFLPRWCSE